jgi:CRISPR/Cas system-associated exonuclease Cas4 (RecB family)
MIEELTSQSDWTTTLRVSKSQLQTYLMCPLKFYFTYVTGQAWEFTPAVLPFGRAIHAAAAYFYRQVQATGEKPSLDALLEEWRMAWAVESAAEDIRYEKLSAEDLAALGERMLARFHAAAAPRAIAAVEYPFAVPLVDPDTGETLDVSLVGIIDLIEMDDDGNLIVAELKTAAKKMTDGEAEAKLDALVYAYAMTQLGLSPADALVRFDVLTKTKEPEFQQMFVTKDDGDFRRLMRWIRDILRSIEAGAFHAAPGWACKQCQFQKACQERMGR